MILGVEGGVWREMTRSQMGCADLDGTPELPGEESCAIWQEGKLGKL